MSVKRPLQPDHEGSDDNATWTTSAAEARLNYFGISIPAK